MKGEVIKWFDDKGEKMKGEVIKWFDDKGFGFVKNEDKTYFLHVSHMANQEAPNIGDMVKFQPIETDRGLQAHNAIIV